MAHFNIPIFIPHLGCPFQCIFCNQKYISGTFKAPDIDDIHSIIQEKLSTIDTKNASVEVAFFGGSFTCLSFSEQEKYLAAVQPYIADNKVIGIRISTRPDYINEDILRLLKKYHVVTIELGVQSLNDSTLAQIERGHTATEVEEASALIRKNGFALGIQTMVGLPGEDRGCEEYTASKVIRIKPDCVRIYPVLVLQDTELERLFLEGTYAPMPLSDAVIRTAALLKMYINNDINVIKVGLHPSDEYGLGGKLVAGPFHPSFREMVMTEVWKNEFLNSNILEQKPDTRKDLTITVPDSQYNYAIGYKSANKAYLKQYFNRVRFVRSNTLHKLEFNADYC